MGRGKSFSPIETKLLCDNFEEMTIKELEKLLSKHGYRRSRKSINRKLEKLRDEGVISFRSGDTVKRSYQQRKRGSKLPSPSELPDSWGSGWSDDDTTDT